jgi:hypothetical protein
MTLAPGRYPICAVCFTPHPRTGLHDPQCPGWVNLGSGDLDAGCIAVIEARFAAGRSCVPLEKRKAQGTML